MIKVEVIEDFTLFDRFKEIPKESIVRKNENNKKDGYLYVEDTFECEKDLAEYLLGENRLNRAFIKVIEIIPEKPVENEKKSQKEDKKEEKKATKKKTLAKK